MVAHGSQLLRVNVDNVDGGLTLDEDFLVDFGQEPDGPVLAHEVQALHPPCQILSARRNGLYVHPVSVLII